MNEQEFIVYRIKNLINQKLYIGITSRGIKTRFKEHISGQSNCKYLYNSIKKYEKESFEITIIDYADSWEELCQKEIYYIAKLDTYKNGYNQTLGGEGRFGIKLSEEHRGKISDALLGIKRTFSKEHRKKLSEKGKNKKLSEEHKRKIGIANTGKKQTKKSINKMIKSKRKTFG